MPYFGLQVTFGRTCLVRKQFFWVHYKYLDRLIGHLSIEANINCLRTKEYRKFRCWLETLGVR